MADSACDADRAKKPAPTPAPPTTEDVPMCSLPPRDAPWSGGYSQVSGWGADTADIAGRHFASARRIAQEGLTLCSVPVVAAVQWGLCQPPGDAAPLLDAAWSPFLSAPLDDQSTPVVMPLGAPPPETLATAVGGGGAVRASYGGMAVHASLAWALLPVIEPGLGLGVARLLHAVLALFGHAAVVLPPGRLCGQARAVTVPPEGSAEATGSVGSTAELARTVEALLDSACGASRAGDCTVDALLRAALASTAVIRASGLAGSDRNALSAWLSGLSSIAFEFPVVRSPREAVAALAPALSRWMVSGTDAAAVANITVASMDAHWGGPDAPLTSAALVYLYSIADSLVAGVSRSVRARGYDFDSSCSWTGDTEESAADPRDLAALPASLGVPPPVDVASYRHLRHCFADGAHVRDIVLVIV